MTKTVVSNIKTSVEKSIDRIGSIYSSMDEDKSVDGQGMSPGHSPTVEVGIGGVVLRIGVLSLKDFFN